MRTRTKPTSGFVVSLVSLLLAGLIPCWVAAVSPANAESSEAAQWGAIAGGKLSSILNNKCHHCWQTRCAAAATTRRSPARASCDTLCEAQWLRLCHLALTLRVENCIECFNADA